MLNHTLTTPRSHASSPANFTLKSSVGNNGKIDIYPNEFVPGRHVVHYILRTEQTSIASGQTFVTNVWVEETYDDDAMVYSVSSKTKLLIKLLSCLVWSLTYDSNRFAPSFLDQIKSQAADEPTLLFQSSVQPLPTTIHQPLVALFNNFLQSFQSHDLDNLMSLHANNNDRVTSINLLPGPLTHGKQALRTQYSLLMQLGLHTFNLLSPVYTPTPNKAFAKISMEFTDPTYPALFGNSPECILGMMTNDHGEIVRVWRTETMGTFEFARRLASAGRNLVAEMDKGVDSVRGR